MSNWRQSNRNRGHSRSTFGPSHSYTREFVRQPQPTRGFTDLDRESYQAYREDLQHNVRPPRPATRQSHPNPQYRNEPVINVTQHSDNRLSDKYQAEASSPTLRSPEKSSEQSCYLEQRSGNKTSFQGPARPSPASHDKDNHQESFCDYCGDDILCEQLSNTEDTLYHTDCVSYKTRSADAVRTFLDSDARCDRVLSMAIHVKYLYGLRNKKKDKQEKNKKKKRDRKLRELVKKVCALRNSNSGYILIHLVGLTPGDSYTGKFDEFADPKLQDLITDGSLFDDVYKKQVLSEFAKEEDVEDLKKRLEEFSDILVLFVQGATYLTTSDFKTKISLDDRIIDATDSTVFEFLRKRKAFVETFPAKINNEAAILQLRENRSVQLKGFFSADDKEIDVVSSMFHHKLVEYISAFTKNVKGGSYFFGVHETPNSQTDYDSFVLEITPVFVEDCDQVERDTTVKVKKSILVCDYDGKVLQDADIVEVYVVSDLHTAAGCQFPGSCGVNVANSKVPCVIGVVVRPLQGLVFYEKGGPLAYKVEEAAGKECSVTGYSFDEWFHCFTRRTLLVTDV